MTNAWWWAKSKATVFPACNSWLDFRVRGQFEIKILIVRHLNTTYLISIFLKKLNLSLFIILSPYLKTSNLSADNFQKNTWLRWVDIWDCDTVKWYWSADTLFWQLSIDHNIDVQYMYIISFPALRNKPESMRLNIDRDLVKQLTGQRTASK